MESSSLVLNTSNTKRFVIEDSITKVTSDGEPHEMMTMIAGLSGLLAAVGILTVLVFLVACKKSKSQHDCDKCSETGATAVKTTEAEGENQSKCSNTTTNNNPKQLEARSISVICGRNDEMECRPNRGNLQGNLQGNLNKAFESSETDLKNTLKTPKQKKRTHWQDEMEMQRETFIQIERY